MLRVDKIGKTNKIKFGKNNKITIANNIIKIKISITALIKMHDTSLDLADKLLSIRHMTGEYSSISNDCRSLLESLGADFIELSDQLTLTSTDLIYKIVIIDEQNNVQKHRFIKVSSILAASKDFTGRDEQLAQLTNQLNLSTSLSFLIFTIRSF